MPSSYTTSARFTLQATGENNNTWGVILNTGVFQLVDSNINGVANITLSGTYTLTTANGAADEARASALSLTGTGGTLTIPSVSKPYDVSNGCSGIATVTTGSGGTVQIRAGETVRIRCDGTNATRVQPFYFSNQRIQGVLDPTSAQDAATKNYVDNTAFSMAAGALPGQAGNAGTFLSTNGTTASWLAISLGSIGALTTASTWTATQTFNGSSTTLAATFQNIAEIFMAGGSPAPLATTNFDLLTQATTVYTTAATTNWTLNVRGNSSTTLNAVVPTGQIVTVCTVVRQGASPFYNNVFQIDGVTQTPVWIGGPPVAGNANGYDVYTYAIFKLASASYLILASQTQFK